MNHCLLMMGGVGSRFGADRPKQYIEIKGKPIFIYILIRLLKTNCIDDVVIVTNAMWNDYVKKNISQFVNSAKKIVVVNGGRTRSESVKNGLTALKEIASDEDVVLIHDATHPYVDQEGTAKVFEAVKEYGGATLGACQYDTCYQMNEDGLIQNVIPRQYIVSGASPEAFRFRIIYDIYMNASEDELEKMTSAGAIALAHDISMKVVPANVLNLKITFQQDMDLFKKLIDNYFFEGE